MQKFSSKSTAACTCLLRLQPAVVWLVLFLAITGCDWGGSGGDGEAPAAPTGLEATSQDGAISLTWDEGGEADAYRVYRSTESGVDVSGSPLETGIGAAEHVDETVTNGTTYYYVVTAVAGESAESNPSNEVAKTPFTDPPDRP